MKTRRFDVDFRRHVEPRIQHMIELHGMLVAFGLVGFTEAYYAIVHFASSRGAQHLSPGLLEELEEWIECALGDAIEAELEG